MKKKIHQDIYISVFVYAFAFTMLFLGHNIKNAESKLYPFICIGLIIILNTILMISALIKGKKMSSAELDAANTVRWQEIKKPLFIFLGVLIYVVVFDFFGYFVATAVMMTGFMWILGVRNRKTLLLVPAVLLMLIYLFFVIKLHVPLM